MGKTEDHWPRIARSFWGSIYLQELYWLARENVELCSEIFTEEPMTAESSDTYIRVDHARHAKIYRVLNNSARIGALIKERGRRSNQSAGQYKIQTERVKWLRLALEGVETKEILHAKVRHSLEHFDEFIDETALKSSRGDIARPTFFPIDIILSHEDVLAVYAKDQLKGSVFYPLRVYISESRSFVNCGRRIDLGRLHAESHAIAERAATILTSLKSVDPRDFTERTGRILVMDDQSFDE
jgi:hypothetical protein